MGRGLWGFLGCQQIACVGAAELAGFVGGLDIGDVAKKRLLALTPATYTGLASAVVDEI